MCEQRQLTPYRFHSFVKLVSERIRQLASSTFLGKRLPAQHQHLDCSECNPAHGGHLSNLSAILRLALSVIQKRGH